MCLDILRFFFNWSLNQGQQTNEILGFLEKGKFRRKKKKFMIRKDYNNKKQKFYYQI